MADEACEDPAGYSKFAPATDALRKALTGLPDGTLTLCVVARDEKAAQGDRRAAAQGLADIAKIDLQGTWLYKNVVWTLVDLLGDRDGGLRQIAFTALQPVHADALGYNPAMQEGPRAKALERWAEWATKVCGAKP